MRGLGVVVFAIAALAFTACTTMPSSGPRSIILNGKTYSETEVGKFVTWSCEDVVHSSGTLVEVGIFTDTKLSEAGFILYDGGNSGELSHYHRRGINHRWDWGPNGNEYAFVLKPDGIGFFYDFSSVPSGQPIKANDVYKCSQKKA